MNNALEDLEPELEGQAVINQERTQHVGVHLIQAETVFKELNGTITRDQMAYFSVVSHVGNQYIMVLYNHDSNVILVIGAKGRKG